MQQADVNIAEAIDFYLPLLQSVPEAEMNHKPSPDRWSKKEILGHLVDSAQNNIRRFIVAQYEQIPVIVYNQDAWVSASGYRHTDSGELIQLWLMINRHICHVIKNIPPEKMQMQCRTEEVHTLEWLADDYVRHMKHHLHQVLDLEPVPYR